MCYEKSNIPYRTDRLGKLTKHHRRPRSKGGSDLPENISLVPEKLHNAWHLLFSNCSVSEIARIMNEHWIDDVYYMVAVPKEYLKNCPK